MVLQHQFDGLLEVMPENPRKKLRFTSRHIAAVNRYLDDKYFDPKEEKWSNLHPKYRIVLENLIRQTGPRLSPQVTLFLPNTFNGAFAPRQPFGLPSYFYHTCKKAESITQATHAMNQEYTVKMKNLNDQIDAYIYDTHLDILKVTEKRGDYLKNIPHDFGEHPDNPRNGQDNPKIELEHREILWNGLKVVLENGRFYETSTTETNVVEIFLNDELLNDKLYILKAEFFAAFYASEEATQIEVMVLFDNYFMAGGTIQYGEKLVCHLQEIPGTYGTTSFSCSSDFKSMVRKCGLPPIPRIGSPWNSDLMESIAELQQAIIRLENRVYDKDYIGKYTHENGGFIEAYCASLKNLSNTLYLLEEGTIELPAHSKNWTPREKLAYLSNFAPEKEMTSCEIGKPCASFKMIIGLAKSLRKNPYNFSFSGELLAEFSFQIRMAMLSMYLVLERNLPDAPHDNSQFVMTTLSHFRRLYIDNVKKIYQIFPHFPVEMRPVVLDVMCQRATPANYQEILEIYSYEPDMVTKMVQKYPYILLFTPHVTRPPIKLIRDFSEYMEKEMMSSEQAQMSRVDVIVLEENEPDGQESGVDYILARSNKRARVDFEKLDLLLESIMPEEAPARDYRKNTSEGHLAEIFGPTNNEEAEEEPSLPSCSYSTPKRVNRAKPALDSPSGNLRTANKDQVDLLDNVMQRSEKRQWKM
ncbi:RING-type E3 ubiquitin transferase [Caenorhabditis elegans]|uniref:RING-type E3 ubiquitin transferase n=1 Tax=Caenorhabditis elegans TaxID=6239 RepID=Q9XW67_CAEEL|nr:RING-type E3 ubiquitin transferase [Caenorhabditis elegans]CAA22104.1 RING-type E3 ubiquitin transferase [Caenorhabditis elegans]|eukprot:NP_499591.1 Uncharacterized protein CELE_Y75B8A.19 [Caenorhabditis elegans]